jgi:hypothetical protein
MQLTFVHLDGSKKGQTEVFENAIVAVGRDPSNQLVFDAFKDVDVSSRHAQFLYQGEQLLVQDLGSRNGTFLNGGRIGNQPMPVPGTAIVQFGDKGPKVQVTYKAVPLAPGKKTQMIADLQNQMQAQQKKAAASKGMMVVLLLFLVVVGGGGGVFWSWYSSRRKNQDLIAKNETRLANAKSDASSSEAEKYAPDDLKKAQDVEKEFAAAKAAGNLDVAVNKLDDAIEAYDRAGKKADKKGNQIRFEAAQKNIISEQTKADGTRAVEKQNADAKKKDDDQKKLKEIEGRLAQITGIAQLKPIVEAALASNKIAEVDKVIATVADKAKAPASAGGGDPQYTLWLGQLSARRDVLAAIPGKLSKAADAAKPLVVAIQTMAYAIPKGQNEKTTSIQELVAWKEGTGFLVTKDKIVTTKETVEPWKFDGQAMAIAAKWDKDFGYQVHTKTDVLFLDTAGVYTTIATFTTPPVDNTPAPKILFRGADSFVDKPVDQTIVFKGATSVMPVQVHRRESGNIAVIQLSTPASASLDVSLSEPKAGDQVVVMVQQKTAPGAETLGLFAQNTEVTTQANSSDVFLGTGGFATWAGGCVLNADGKVVGMIDEVQGEWMRMLSPMGILQAAGR